MVRIFRLFIIFAFAVSMTGCAIFVYSGRPSDKKKIEELERLRQQEKQELQAALDELKRRLKDEIDSKDISVKLAERGLVLTFVSEVLFDSGKAKVRPEAYKTLDKVIEIIKEKVPDKNIGVEGYTDNQAIKHSGWNSNWELSTARATAVLHYFEKEGIDGRRLQATGYGEYRPIESNDTASGRAKNRRVEVVIIPTKVDKISMKDEAAAQGPEAEGLK